MSSDIQEYLYNITEGEDYINSPSYENTELNTGYLCKYYARINKDTTYSQVSNTGIKYTVYILKVTYDDLNNPDVYDFDPIEYYVSTSNEAWYY